MKDKTKRRALMKQITEEGKNSIGFYRAEANWYTRIVRESDGFVWDENAQAMAAAPTWSNSVITLVWDSTIGGYPVNLPTLSLDDYGILFYNAASPVAGDVIQYGQTYTVDTFAL